MGADDRHRRHPRGRRLRRAGAGPVAPHAVADAAPVHRAVVRHGRRRPPAQRRPLVGRVRRRRADRGRHRPPGRRGPPAGPLARAVGRARPGRPQGGGGRPRRAGRHQTQLTGAEILRHAVGPRGLAAGGGRHGRGRRLGDRPAGPGAATPPPIRSHEPEGFRGQLRTYQAEALAWLGFLDAVELGGCLALDMGLGKTPTVLAHIGRTTGDGTALVVAPPAVVGNWAAEAAPLHPRPEGRHPPRCRAGLGRRARAGPSAAPTSSSPPTARPSATSTPCPRSRGTGSCSTRRRRSRTRPTRPRSSCGASTPAPAWRSPARPSRTGWATCGPSSTS